MTSTFEVDHPAMSFPMLPALLNKLSEPAILINIGPDGPVAIHANDALFTLLGCQRGAADPPSLKLFTPRDDLLLQACVNSLRLKQEQRSTIPCHNNASQGEQPSFTVTISPLSEQWCLCVVHGTSKSPPSPALAAATTVTTVDSSRVLAMLAHV